MELITIPVPEALCELVNGLSGAELERAMAAAGEPPEVTAEAFRGLGLAFAIGRRRACRARR
jgi:hypothetical protein